MTQIATQRSTVAKLRRVETALAAGAQPFAGGEVSRRAETSPFNELLSNELLAVLPRHEFARLLPHLEPVTLKVGEDLFHYVDKNQFAYFPESAVISQLHVLGDGNTTEAAMIGKEGAVGLWTIFGSGRPSYWTRVLFEGIALRIEAGALRTEFRRGGPLQHAVLAYASARMAQLSQRAVCNGRHSVEERFCSWLLMVRDRAGVDTLPLTHEQIAGHLGTRRAGITTAAAALRDDHVVDYSRGRIRIIDREALESACCECYRTLGKKAAVTG